MLRKELILSKGVPIVVGLIFTSIGYVTIKRYLVRRRYSHIPGPKTKGLLEFFLGNITEISTTVKQGKCFQDQVLAWAKIYGKVFKIQFFGNYTIIMNDPDLIKEMLIENNIPKTVIIYPHLAFPQGQRFTGTGLLTQRDHELWKKQRAQFNSGFHRSVLMDCLKEFNSKADILMEKLRKQADGKTVIQIGREMNYVALDVIASVAFGINTDSINGRSELYHMIVKSLTGVNKSIFDPLMKLKPYRWKEVKELTESIKNLRIFAKDILVDRIQKIQNNEYVANDILSVIINHAKGQDLDFEELIDQFITIFVAGQETTANTLAFSFLELGRNPHVLEKLKEEIDRVLGAKTEIKNEDLVALEYTGCVFKETLRKWPTAPQFSRQTTQDMIVRDYFLPKDSWVQFSPYLLGRNPEYFPNPDVFDPDRFMGKSTNNVINSYTYFPFSIGPRNCIGQNFAQIEGKVILAKFIQNFNFVLDPTQTSRIREAITISPEDGVRAFLTIRD